MAQVRWKQFNAVFFDDPEWLQIRLRSGHWFPVAAGPDWGTARVRLKQIEDGDELLRRYLKATDNAFKIVVNIDTWEREETP